MQKSLEQELELDATATGHDAIRLQAAKQGPPTYPWQPGNVWNDVDRGPAPTTGVSTVRVGPDGRPELVPVPTKVKRGGR
jgi:hypothetical protein